MPTTNRVSAPATPPRAAAPATPVDTGSSGDLSLDDIAAAVERGDTFETPAETPAPLPAPAGHVAPTHHKKPILFYNQYCETCDAIAGWVKRADKKGGDLISERPIPKYQEDLDKIVPGLDLNEVYATSHLIMPDGTVYQGGEAVREVLERLNSTKWFADVFQVEIAGHKPFQAALNAGYHILDASRPALGCTSCGPNAVPTWAKPIKWVVDGVKVIEHLVHDDAKKPAHS